MTFCFFYVEIVPIKPIWGKTSQGAKNMVMEYAKAYRKTLRIFSNIDPLPTLYGEFHKYFFEPFPKAVLSSALPSALGFYPPARSMTRQLYSTQYTPVQSYRVTTV